MTHSPPHLPPSSIDPTRIPHSSPTTTPDTWPSHEPPPTPPLTCTASCFSRPASTCMAPALDSSFWLLISLLMFFKQPVMNTKGWEAGREGGPGGGRAGSWSERVWLG